MLCRRNWNLIHFFEIIVLKNVPLENASLENWTYGTEGKLHIFSQNFIIERMLICAFLGKLHVLSQNTVERKLCFAFLAHQAASVKGV